MALLRNVPGREIVLSLDEPASRVVAAGLDVVVQAARAGPALAGIIVAHLGATIPRNAMPIFPTKTLS